jgi:cephalosporin-C deacetylase-like acetyl esterase
MGRSRTLPPVVALALAVVALVTPACMRFASNYPTTHLAAHRPDLPVPNGYEYRKTAAPATLERQSISADGRYETYALTLPSVGGDGQEQLLVTAQYLKAKTSGTKKLVIVVPIYGSISFASKMMAKQLIEWQKQDTNVLLIQDAHDIFDGDIARGPIVMTEAEMLQGVQRCVTHFRHVVIAIRRLIDWAETAAEIDTARIGVVGFSIGASVANVAMGIDARIAAGAFVLPATDLHEILAFGRVPRWQEPIDQVRANLKLTRDEFARKVEPILRPIDPIYFSQSIDPARVLLIEAAQDSFVPAEARKRHWEALGRPRLIRIDYDHKAALLLSMTFLGRRFTERAIVTFFDETL